MIPCKRPKVTVQPSPVVHGLYDHVCQVPGCDWTFTSVKTATDSAWHRRQHRDAVPRAWLKRDVEWDVYCEPCGGHRRAFGTRTDAQAWLDHHLSAEHGLVSC